MGIETLLRELKAVLERVTGEMRLPVNMDSEFYEETAEMPLSREEDFPLGEVPEVEADGEEKTEPIRKREQEYRAPYVYIMNTPDRSDQVSNVPYLLLQFLNGKDTRTSEDKGYDLYTEVELRLLIATYNLDGQAGGLQVVDILERIRTVLMRGIMLGDNYLLQEPLEYQVYPDNTGRYFLGEMDMTWRIPRIERDCRSVEEALESGSMVGSGLMSEEELWNRMNF